MATAYQVGKAGEGERVRSEVIRCLENLICLIQNGYDAPETVEMESWDAACQAYRDSQSFQDAQQALAHAELGLAQPEE